jgi:hypothetical protein
VVNPVQARGDHEPREAPLEVRIEPDVGVVEENGYEQPGNETSPAVFESF